VRKPFGIGSLDTTRLVDVSITEKSPATSHHVNMFPIGADCNTRWEPFGMGTRVDSILEPCRSLTLSQDLHAHVECLPSVQSQSRLGPPA